MNYIESTIKEFEDKVEMFGLNWNYQDYIRRSLTGLLTKAKEAVPEEVDTSEMKFHEELKVIAWNACRAVTLNNLNNL